MNENNARHIAAQCWCTPETQHLQMIPELAEAFAAKLTKMVPENEIVSNLGQQLQEDSDRAWSWHCNIAMPLQDMGVSHEEANKQAARIMQQIFKIDTSQHPIFKRFEYEE